MKTAFDWRLNIWIQDFLKENVLQQRQIVCWNLCKNRLTIHL